MFHNEDMRNFTYFGTLDLFPGMQMDRPVEEELHSSHCCLVAIGRLQVSYISLLTRFILTLLINKNLYHSNSLPTSIKLCKVALGNVSFMISITEKIDLNNDEISIIS